MMESDYFKREGAEGVLQVEGLDLEALANQHGTPLYVYSQAAILDSYQEFVDALEGIPSLVCVSVKANGNLSLLSLLAKKGAGFDVVTGGELARVIAAGGDARKVVFSGVGKTDEEILRALDAGILMFNVESRAELERLNFLAGKHGKGSARAALRVNPDVDAKSHPYISTGMEKHKFGIPVPEARELYLSAGEYPNIEFVGVDCHIGSMITDLGAFDEAFLKLRELILELQESLPNLQYVDLGGGIGVCYENEVAPKLSEFGDIVRERLLDLGLTIILEPGRRIFANAGLLLSRVVYVKRNTKKRFVILDAGFSELIRPVLYQAYHEILPVKLSGRTAAGKADIVGPICESTDCFAYDREFPEVNQGELIAVASAGAYGFVMASNYNNRPRPAEILVNGTQAKLVRPRETVEELFAAEQALL